MKRLPYDVINFEIDLMKDLGVKIEHGRSDFGHDAEGGDREDFIVIDLFYESFSINNNTKGRQRLYQFQTSRQR